MKTELETEVGSAICAQKLQGNQSTYVRGCIMTSTGEIINRLDEAYKLMDRVGPSYMQQQTIANDLAHRSGEMSAKRSDGVLSWGIKIPLGDCEVQEIAIGKFH